MVYDGFVCVVCFIYILFDGDVIFCFFMVERFFGEFVFYNFCCIGFLVVDCVVWGLVWVVFNVLDMDGYLGYFSKYG